MRKNNGANYILYNWAVSRGFAKIQQKFFLSGLGRAIEKINWTSLGFLLYSNPYQRNYLHIMAKKHFFAILDTETTINDTVADFAIVICDRNGQIYNQCAVLVRGHYDSMELFHDTTKSDIWGLSGLQKRKNQYAAHLDNGIRMIASVNAINKWINQAIGKYNPTLTAYNLAFDNNKCQNTGIDLSGFNNRFCLWQAAIGNICQTKKYRQFCVDNHQFNNSTKNGNMTFKTTAETVCGFLNNNMQTEPHTALEDARDFELPILVNIIKKRNWETKIQAYDWNNFQVKNHFQAK